MQNEMFTGPVTNGAEGGVAASAARCSRQSAGEMFDVAVGLMPFIIGDIIKATLAALAFPLAWKLIGRGKDGAGQPMW